MRLRAQGLVSGVRPWATPADVARGMLAMQAQDPKGILWALSMRSSDHPTESEVLADLAGGRIVRNRPSRGTLQVTAPEDLHWLSETMTPRSLAAAVKRRDQIGVTEEMVSRVGEVLRRELADGSSAPDLRSSKRAPRRASTSTAPRPATSSGTTPR